MPRRGPVHIATQRELDDLGKLDAKLGPASALGALAVSLARRIDDPKTSATAASMLSGQLRDTLAQLHAAAPEQPRADDVSRISDELAERRAAVAAGT